MSTRSNIGILRGEGGKVELIYCHWDGYPEHNGKILIEHYNKLSKLEKLMKLGDLSILGPELGTKHNFETKDYSVCTAYGRDRGDRECNCRYFDSIHELNNNVEEYCYLYDVDNQEWILSDDGGHTFSKLADVLAELI